MKYIEKHKVMVESDNDYIYNGTYEVNEIMLNGKPRPSGRPYILVTHEYCKKQSYIRIDSWENGRRPHNKAGGCCCGNYENSFAYYIEKELKLDINKILNMNKNKKLGLNPYHLHKQATTKIWFLCQKHSYHNDFEGYKMDCHHFYNGNRCPYCAGKKIHIKDSFAQWGINKYGEDFLDKYWSKNNNVNPWTIHPQYNGYIYLICQWCNREYKIKANNFYNGCNCNICNKSAGEINIYSFLEKYNIKKEPQKTFNDLIGINNGLLSYDFYLPEYNILIEFQGQHHDGTMYKKGFQTKEQFNRQKEHDRRKRMYAIENNIRLLEIWYWDFNNINNILTQLLLKK